MPDNNLVTFLEDVTIQMAERSSITYRRLNHKDFSFHIKLSNPELKKRKIIVRIFLGIKTEETHNGIVWWVSRMGSVCHTNFLSKEL